MNYYIDFDNTLYDTPKLVERMAEAVARSVADKTGIDYKTVFGKIKAGEKDIYQIAADIAHEYGVSEKELKSEIEKVIMNGENLVFEDVIPYLKQLRAEGNKIFMLTYSKFSTEFQTIKVLGSGLLAFFDGTIITDIPKDELDIKYENGIFIDDNPRDLLGLYSKNPIQVIRIRRKGNKYSIPEIPNTDIVEYKDFKELMKEKGQEVDIRLIYKKI